MTKKSSKDVVATAKQKLTESIEAAATVLEASLEIEEVAAVEVTEETVVVDQPVEVVEASEDKEDKEEKSDEKDADDKKKFTESADTGTEAIVEDSDTVEGSLVDTITLEVVTPSVQEDVDAILNGDETLSEGFKEKISTVFEAALSAKIKEITAQIEESAKAQLEAKVKEIQEATEKHAEEFLDVVAEEWISENELQVEQGLRIQLAEGFIQDLKGLFESYNISMPEEKIDLLEEKTKEVTELKDQVTALTEATSAKDKEIFEFKKLEVLRVLSEGLVDTQKEKLSALVSDVVAESVEAFKEKASIIKESYFSKKEDNSSKKEVKESTNDAMAGYAAHARKLNTTNY